MAPVYEGNLAEIDLQTPTPESMLGKKNQDDVVASMYHAMDAATAAGINFKSNDERHFLVAPHMSRIRQTTIYDKLVININNLTNIDTMIFKVWRQKANDNFQEIYSEDILSKVSTGTNTIELATPTEFQEGDYLGIGGVTSGTITSTFFTIPSLLPFGTYRIDSTTPSTTDADFIGGALTTLSCPQMRVLAKAPALVSIGTSLTQGANIHGSYVQESRTDNDPSSVYGAKVAIALGVDHQNMGIGSENSTTREARFDADVVALKPRMVIIENGANDNWSSSDRDTYVTKMTSMLDKCLKNGIIPILLLNFPITARSNANHQEADARDLITTAYAEAYGAVLVDPHEVLGQFRTGGDAGNRWDYVPAYTSDDTHLTATANTLLANEIVAKIRAYSLQQHDRMMLKANELLS